MHAQSVFIHRMGLQICYDHLHKTSSLPVDWPKKLNNRKNPRINHLDKKKENGPPAERVRTGQMRQCHARVGATAGDIFSPSFSTAANYLVGEVFTTLRARTTRYRH